MKDDTPYDQPLRVLAQKQISMEWVFREAPSVDYIFEAFGGLGITTLEIAARFPKTPIISVEADTGCVEKARVRTAGCRVTHIQGDALISMRTWAPPGLRGISLDFNQFTLLDLVTRSGWRKLVLREALKLYPMWLHLTDTSRSKLHLHWKRYGLENGDYFTYINALDDWFQDNANMRIMRGARRHTSNYLLLQRTDEMMSNQWNLQKTDLQTVEVFERIAPA